MKKKYYMIAVLAAAALTSCVKEQLSSEVTPLGENAVAFVLGGTSTKSADAAQAQVTGLSFPVGTDDKGNNYYLQETIETLNPAPATKGAPAYTQNVGTLYTEMGVYAVGGNFGTDPVTFSAQDMYENPNGGQGWRYSKEYSSTPWTDEDSVVDFYLNMPASPTGVTFTGRADKKITFDYKAPNIGVAQQDLIFAQTSITKATHDGYLPKGAPVMMYHALTGIKFRSGSDNGGSTKTVITNVVISGLNDMGTCVVDVNATNEADRVIWSDLGMNLGSFSQDFTNPDYKEEDGKNNPDGTVDYGEYGEDSTFGESWYAAAGNRNLNLEDGSQTFWLIPQDFAELTDEQAAAVTLQVTFRVKTPDTPNGTSITHTIKDFGTKLKAAAVNWRAGDLRTYTLDPKDVDVEIFDHMEGYVKSNLHVTNTGNVDEYVRMMVIGNWYGWLPDEDPEKDEPTILVGYKTETGDEMVDAWYREDPTFSTGFDYGLSDRTFVGGRPVAGKNEWVRGTGSYFYYPHVIGAGIQLRPDAEALFKNYTLDQSWIPTIWIPSVEGGRVQAIGVHLVMECVIQAIGAPKKMEGGEYVVDEDGNFVYETWQKAWSDATGETIEQK